MTNRMRLIKIVAKASICFEDAKVVFWEESLWAPAKDYVHIPLLCNTAADIGRQ